MLNVLMYLIRWRRLMTKIERQKKGKTEERQGGL